MAVLFSYPLWFIGICVLFASGLTALLYFRNKHQTFPFWLTVSAGVFRFLALFLLSLLLLGPMVKTTVSRTEKPLVIIGIDNSRSMIIHSDSTGLRNNILQNLKTVESELGSSFDIVYETFGEETHDGAKLNFSEKQTDISAFLKAAGEKYYNRNTGAMILVSDGIYNRGANPLYQADVPGFPIYTVVAGDTSVQRDLILQKVNFNRITFLGSRFPLEIIVKANNCKGSNSKVSVFQHGKSLFAERFGVVNNNQVFTFPVEIEANELGLNKYSIVVESVANEKTIQNNKTDVFIDVKDTRQKILMVANSPHPDVSALRTEFETNTLYDFKFVLADELKTDDASFNLIILHQLPSIKNNMKVLLEGAKKRHTPILFILGPQTNVSMFNEFNAGISIQSQQQVLVNAFPVLNPQFGLFTVSKDLYRFVGQLPPLVSFLAKYNSSGVSESVFYQNLAGLQTNTPLFTFTRNGPDIYGIIAGEGLWWWRFKLYALSGSHELFSDLIRKTVQYLSLNEETGNFRVRAKQEFTENETIEFNAELYNPSFELVNTPDIELDIVNDKGVSYPFVFSRTASAYKLNAGKMPPGSYTWTAKTTFNNSKLGASGSFSVNAINVEELVTRADQALMQGLALKSGGRLFNFPATDSLAGLIKANNQIKPLVYSEKRLHDLVSLWGMMVLLILLPGIEWALRKWGGRL